jgi:hypothetical protein
MIRARTVARMGNQKVCRERERAVVCDCRFVPLRIGRCGVDNNAVDIYVAEIANVSHRQRQRGVSDPLVAAGEIAHVVKSRGRSRHGYP